jgi:hypothetical protein
MTEPGEVDSSGNPIEETPRRDDPDGSFADEDTEAEPDHPGSPEKYRG